MRESRDLRVATCKFTLSDDNRKRLARDSSLVNPSFRERERDSGKENSDG